jgi:2'-5' RNA ligase
MRVFACSVLSTPAQQVCRRQIAALVAESRGLLRSIPADSAHLTHAFVSHAPDDRTADLVDAIARVATRHEAFDIRLGMPFVLYGGSEARLVCAPVIAGTEALGALGADCVRALTTLLSGDAVSGSRSHHVTLARFRKQTPRRDGRQMEGRLAALEAHDDRVARVQLMVSRLTPAGPVYVPLVDVPLG